MGASAWHFCVFGLWVFCVCWWAPAALLGVASSDAVKQGSAGLGWLDQCCLCCGLGWAAPGGLAAWPWLGRAGLSWAVPRAQPSTYPLEKVYVPCLAPLCSVGEISDLRWREFVGAVLGCVVPGSAGLGCAGLCLAVPGPTAGSGWTGLGRAWHDLPRQVGLGVLVWLPILGSSVSRFLLVFCVCWWAPAALLDIASSDAVKLCSVGLGWLGQSCLSCGLGWAALGGLAACPWLARAGLSWAVPLTQPSTYPLEKVYVPCLASLCSVGEIWDLRWREFAGAVLGCSGLGWAWLRWPAPCCARPDCWLGLDWVGQGLA